MMAESVTRSVPERGFNYDESVDSTPQITLDPAIFTMFLIMCVCVCIYYTTHSCKYVSSSSSNTGVKFSGLFFWKADLLWH